MKSKIEFHAARYCDDIIIVDQITSYSGRYHPRVISVYEDADERWSMIEGAETAMRWSDMTRIPVSDLPDGAREAFAGASS